MNAKYIELVEKLKEIFELDKPEIDFGIYRILHSRSKQINDFLDNHLQAKVREALTGNKAAQIARLEQELQKARANAENLGIADVDSTPKVQELKAQLEQFGNAEQSENEVYSHLLTFFSRYYDKGDFISLRRYKGDTYAIPYSGEEVKLHWANADQYYIKSSENFSHYDFALKDGAKVHFRLISAQLTKDNIKDNDAVRCFVLWHPEEAADAEEEYPSSPIEEKDGELYVYFQYRRFKKEGKKNEEEAMQKKQSDSATDVFLKLLVADNQLYQRFAELDSEAPTEKDRHRKLFRKHLDAYTEKNKSDYFIHKNLKKFLTTELDFYIKNEMLNLDDIQQTASFSLIEVGLRTIQAVRAIASDLIDFMSQIENFQKRLWLKKKMVIQTNWCFTLRLVPKALWNKILENDAQRNEWQLLFDESIKIDANFIQKNDTLIVDTQHFSESFKHQLIKSIFENYNVEAINLGEMIHGDNFHALRLLKNLYRNSIQCVYIDPPYNSPSSEVLYKNSYKHSSWLSLMDSRMREERDLLTSNSATVIAIDKYEHNNLFFLCSQNYCDHDIVSVAIEHNKKGVQGDHFSFSNEYAIFCVSNAITHLNKTQRPIEEWEYSNFRNWGTESLRQDAANCFYPVYVKDNTIIGFGTVLPDSVHPTAANEVITSPFEYYIPQEGGGMKMERHEIVDTEQIIAVWPIDSKNTERKWRYSTDGIHRIFSKLRIKQKNDHSPIEIEMPKYEDQYKTLWSKPLYNAGDYGTKLLTNMGFPKADFAFPKSVYTVKDCIHSVSSTSSYILDYFAGSGTTAQAVMLLNQEDGGNRKFILCEMGEYFEKVTLPRVKKSMFAPQFDAWKNGKLVGTPRLQVGLIKYCKLESYDDTLNNLILEIPSATPDLLQDDYLLRYMLDIESRGSLINTDSFQKPFDYKLKVSIDSSGAAQEQRVDLPETFNYLLGLTVLSYDYHLDKGYLMIEGTLPSGDKALVIWRDMEKVDDERLHQLMEQRDIRPGSSEFDVIYVNGDHSLDNHSVSDEENAPTLKIRSLENEFLNLMFTEE